MCGIAGVISWDEKYRVTRETLQRMSAAIAHRGPDGEGFYLNHEQEITPANPQCGFAFRRLAILDPDPRAMQPFTIGDKTIVFNGEIYNFRELRAELTTLRPAYARRTTGDTEVLLMAYDAWGEKCLERLNGMFALAVWDARAKSLFLARDRMGQKPLYVAVPSQVGHRTTVAFASELGSLRVLPWFDARIDTHALRQYLRFGYIGKQWSIYRGAAKVELAEWKRWDDRSERGDVYFVPGGKKLASGDAVTQTHALVAEAVSRQLVSDVPIGCFLSGGVDSSVIAACMRRGLAGAKAFETFSIGFDDPRYDETEYAAAVATHLGTHHHAFTVRPDAARDLPKLAEVFGEPFADSSALPTHYLSRETRGVVKVALSGDGGDELFGGYDRYRAVQAGARLDVLPHVVRAGVGLASTLIRSDHPKSRRARAKRFIAVIAMQPALRYATLVRLFQEKQIEELSLAHVLPGNNGYDTVEGDYVGGQLVGCDPVTAALATDRRNYLPDDLLTKVDRASMLHGLEVRSPFMDHELVQHAAGLTTDQLLKGGPKRMLREAFADDLPAWVFKRKKMGFAVPIGEWFRGELRAMLRDNLFASDSFARQHFNMAVVERLVDEHEQFKVDHSQRLYALLMLELWWRTSR